jgi:ABC-2 type transport system ATP-binding protein
LLNRPKLLICDEPTSALDPVGRKEILDILLAARQQTTVLFSTHILSDVERICTDVAFLDQGVVNIQGPVAQIKNRFRSDEYILETEGEEDSLLQAFPQMQRAEAGGLCFRQREHELQDVLRFLADHRIPLTKLERLEPTLESLFMEVTGA